MRSIPAIEVPPNFITIRATAVASCRMGKTRCLIGGRRGDGKGLGAGLILAQQPHCLISGGESGFGKRSGASRAFGQHLVDRSEEHTSELQSLMRISYAVFCLQKKQTNSHNKQANQQSTRSKPI